MGFNNLRTALIIPAYNEADNISNVLKQTKVFVDKGLIDKIFVIDDASTDGTGRIAREMGVPL